MSVLTANEKGISGKDGLVFAILKQVADTVLCMTGSMQRRNFDVFANSKRFAVLRCLGYLGAVFASDERKRVRLEDLRIAACMIMVAMVDVN